MDASEQLKKVFEHTVDHLARNAKNSFDTYQRYRLEHAEAWASYLELYPIPPEVQTKLIEWVTTGGPICCEFGREKLTEFDIHPLWQKAINGWAYDNLSCGETRPERISENVQKLREAFRQSKIPKWAKSYG